jgi:hypothetical protein
VDVAPSRQGGTRFCGPDPRKDATFDFWVGRRDFWATLGKRDFGNGMKRDLGRMRSNDRFKVERHRTRSQFSALWTIFVDSVPRIDQNRPKLTKIDTHRRRPAVFQPITSLKIDRGQILVGPIHERFHQPLANSHELLRTTGKMRLACDDYTALNPDNSTGQCA